MTRVWRKIYEQNYPRSLDHRSFYFKQQEKKNMMAKAMVGQAARQGTGVGRAWQEEHNRVLGLRVAPKGI